MKNFLMPVMENKIISSITNYCVNHKSSLLAGGTIGFSISTTAIVFRNSPRIHTIIWDTKDALDAANSDEEKKSIYKAALKELAPLVAPIIIFQAGTIACTIITKKDSDKKDKMIAELSTAATVAAQAIEEYKQFQKEAEEVLGEKKLQTVRDNIASKSKPEEINDIDLDSIGDGEFIFKDHYCGHIFKGTKDTVRLACERMSNELYESGDSVCLNGEYYQTLGVDDTSELGDRFGYFAEFDRMHMRPSFSTIEMIINGKEVVGYEVFLTPSPEYIEK